MTTSVAFATGLRAAFKERDACGVDFPTRQWREGPLLERVALITTLRNEAKYSVTLIEIHFLDPWVTQSSVSLPSQNSGMAAWQWWDLSLALALSCWLAKASFIKSALVENVQEPDVWAPETRAGYYRLFFFGSFISVLGVGANTVVHYLWASVNAMNNYFWGFYSKELTLYRHNVDLVRFFL